MFLKLYRKLGDYFHDRADDIEYGPEEDESMKPDYPMERVGKARLGGFVESGEIGSKREVHADPSYSIRIYSANGGRIIECHTVASKSNGFQESSPRLYVINDDADLTAELGKILMIDSLSN